MHTWTLLHAPAAQSQFVQETSVWKPWWKRAFSKRVELNRGEAPHDPAVAQGRGAGGRMFCCSSRDDGKKANNNAARNDLHNGGAGQMPLPHQSGKPVGVGIVFQPDSTGALHVKSLAVGGPAEKCGLVNVGDVLHEIDGHHVYRKPVAQLAPLILGQEGTVVRLGLQRGNLQRLVFVRPHPMPAPAGSPLPRFLALLPARAGRGVSPVVITPCEAQTLLHALPGGAATWMEYADPASTAYTIAGSIKVVASTSSGG